VVDHDHQIRIDSWAQLNEVLFDEPTQAIGRYRSNYAFRGVSQASWGLSSSLIRLGGSYTELEQHIIRSFQKYAHLEMREESSIWNWLSLAQHHGLPTRLLDWTHSPWVALHFATDQTDQFDQDGAIWCVNIVETNKQLARPLKQRLEQTSARVFTSGILNEEVASLTDFDRLSDHPFVAFLEPPSLDARIVNQVGLFSVMSDPSMALDDWLPDAPGVYRQVVIPAELKWEIRDKLDQANINERVLFPGLDGLCMYLKRYYSPKED